MVCPACILPIMAITGGSMSATGQKWLVLGGILLLIITLIIFIYMSKKNSCATCI